MKVFTTRTATSKLIKGSQRSPSSGYGSQGHAHAQNLNDSGGKRSAVRACAAPSWDKVKASCLAVAEIKDAREGRRLRDDADARRAYRRGVPRRDRAEHQEGRDAGLRARLQHPLRAGRAARRPRRRDDRAEGPRPHGRARPTRRRRRCRCWSPSTRTARASRATLRCRTRARSAAARRASSRPTSAKRPKPTSSASRPCCAAAPST